MTRWYEIEKATLKNHGDYKRIGFKRVANIKKVIEMITGPEDYLYRISEWSMNPNNPKSELIRWTNGEEFLLDQ